LHPKLITWLSNTRAVNILDTITKNEVSFNINASIPERADGIMVANSLYVMGGFGPIKSTFELNSIEL